MVLLVSIIHQKEVFSRGRAGLRGGPPRSPGCAGAPCGPLCGACTGLARSRAGGLVQPVGRRSRRTKSGSPRLRRGEPRGARPQGARCAAPFPPAQSQKRESSSSADFWLVRVYRGMRMRQAGSRVSRQGLPSTPREAAKPSCSKSCWLWRLYEPKG